PRRLRRRQMVGLPARVRIRQYPRALCDQLALSRRKPLMKRQEEVEKTGRKIGSRIEILRSGIDGKAFDVIHVARKSNRSGVTAGADRVDASALARAFGLALRK